MLRFRSAALLENRKIEFSARSLEEVMDVTMKPKL